MAFRKLVGSYKDYDLSTHVIEDGYLAVDVDTGSLRIGDGVTAGGTVVSGGGGGSVTGSVTGSGLQHAFSNVPSNVLSFYNLTFSFCEPFSVLCWCSNRYILLINIGQ